MVYRFTIDLFFSTLPPSAWLNAIKTYALNNALNINIGTAKEERSQYLVQRCFHDEVPPKPCVTLEEWVKPD